MQHTTWFVGEKPNIAVEHILYKIQPTFLKYEMEDIVLWRKNALF